MRSAREDADRVLRGGAWNDFPGDCRSAYRSGGNPDARDRGIGFRLSASVAAQGPLTLFLRRGFPADGVVGEIIRGIPSRGAARPAPRPAARPSALP